MKRLDSLMRALVAGSVSLWFGFHAASASAQAQIQTLVIFTDSAIQAIENDPAYSQYANIEEYAQEVIDQLNAGLAGRGLSGIATVTPAGVDYGIFDVEANGPYVEGERRFPTIVDDVAEQWVFEVNTDTNIHGDSINQIRQTHEADVVVVIGASENWTGGAANCFPDAEFPQYNDCIGDPPNSPKSFVIAVDVEALDPGSDFYLWLLLHEFFHLSGLDHDLSAWVEENVLGTLMKGDEQCKPSNGCSHNSELTEAELAIVIQKLAGLSGYFEMLYAGGGGGGGGYPIVPSPPELFAVPHNCEPPPYPGYPPLCEYEIYWYYDGLTEYVILYNFYVQVFQGPAWWQPVNASPGYNPLHITAVACTADWVCSGHSLPMYMPY